ncbi:hypothetical protein FLM52_00475 [bacterium Scap17]|nr:hypothetical protein [bacterium Scap17]
MAGTSAQPGARLRAQGSGLRAQGSGLRAQGSGLRAQGSRPGDQGAGDCAPATRGPPGRRHRSG